VSKTLALPCITLPIGRAQISCKGARMGRDETDRTDVEAMAEWRNESKAGESAFGETPNSTRETRVLLDDCASIMGAL
jgi:hypothetical protein